jgi:hypothetical protein
MTNVLGRLKVFENRVLKRIFETKRGDLIGGCRELHNEDLHKMGWEFRNHGEEDKLIRWKDDIKRILKK